MSTLLRLTYWRKWDIFATVSVLGDPEGIRDLYWQLTNNYSAKDGTEIGGIHIFDLNGIKLDPKLQLQPNPHGCATEQLSTNISA